MPQMTKDQAERLANNMMATVLSENGHHADVALVVEIHEPQPGPGHQCIIHTTELLSPLADPDLRSLLERGFQAVGSGVKQVSR